MQKEAQGGQRTTVDVLNSQQDLISAKARLIGAQRDRVIASYTLLSAIGRLDVKTLGAQHAGLSARGALPSGARRLARPAHAVGAVNLGVRCGAYREAGRAMFISEATRTDSERGRKPMLTRRSMILASIAAGVTMQNRNALANAAQPSTPVNFDVPAGACDCHTHIHGDPEKFPFFSGRVYTPEPASPEEMAALHKALHIERVVIVTPRWCGHLSHP